MWRWSFRTWYGLGVGVFVIACYAVCRGPVGVVRVWRSFVRSFCGGRIWWPHSPCVWCWWWAGGEGVGILRVRGRAVRVVGTIRSPVWVILCLVRRWSGGVEFCVGRRFLWVCGESAVCILCLGGWWWWWCGGLGYVEFREILDTVSGAWISISRGLGRCAS